MNRRESSAGISWMPNGPLVGSFNSRVVAPVLFILSILLSTGLLFLIQPLMASILTPAFADSVWVWPAAFFFFQMMTIFGHLYAHLLTRLPRLRHQIGIHMLLWLSAMGMMPIDFDLMNSHLDSSGQIETAVLSSLMTTVALPFLFLAANTPLIQTWYGRTKGPHHADPYFLYGSAQVGSLIALVSFPLIADVVVGLPSLAFIWQQAFLILGGLLFLSVFWTTRDHPDAKTVSAIINMPTDLRTVWIWSTTAFIPTALMIAITIRVSISFGSSASVWIIPLLLYLITHFAGFRIKPILNDRIMGALYPTSILVMAIVGMSGIFSRLDVGAAVAMIFSFTLVSLHMSRRLYHCRPDTTRLTVFYMAISVGAAFGSLFSGIIAPNLMNGPHELTLAIMAAAAVTTLSDRPDSSTAPKWISLTLLMGIILVISLEMPFYPWSLTWWGLVLMMTAGASAMISIKHRPIGAAAICLAGVISIHSGQSMTNEASAMSAPLMAPLSLPD